MKANHPIEISLTSFVDFLLKSGTPKLTALKKIVDQYSGGYHAECDFYLQWRQALARFHRRSIPPELLAEHFETVSTSKKVKHFVELANGYSEWWEQFSNEHHVEWCEPIRVAWRYRDLRVRINPELHFSDDAGSHLIKLYLKEPKPTRQQIEIGLHLMRRAYRGSTQQLNLGILDVRRGKVFTEKGTTPGITELLRGEALCFSQMYRSFVTV